MCGGNTVLIMECELIYVTWKFSFSKQACSKCSCRLV